MGGTFDPIHHGHLVAASEVADLFELDQVVFVPTGQPLAEDPATSPPPEDRYLMTVIATASNPRFSVSRVDIDRGARPTPSTQCATCARSTRTAICTSSPAPTRWLESILSWQNWRTVRPGRSSSASADPATNGRAHVGTPSTIARGALPRWRCPWRSRPPTVVPRGQGRPDLVPGPGRRGPVHRQRGLYQIGPTGWPHDRGPISESASPEAVAMATVAASRGRQNSPRTSSSSTCPTSW